MFVKIIAIGDVICDSGQLGDCRMFFTEPKLSIGKEVLSVDKGGQSGGYYAFK